MLGIIGYNLQLTNSCAGMLCTPLQVVCNGTIVNNVTDVDFQIATTPGCYITQMLCFGDIGAVHDMAQQHNASSCVVDRLLCNWIEQNASVVDNHAFFDECFIQVNCLSNDRRYGYDLFGFYCAQDEIVCNGVPIDSAAVNTSNVQFMNSLQNCSVHSRGCTTQEVEPYSNSSCYRFTCDGDVLADGCTFFKQFTNCSQSLPQCRVLQLVCEDSNDTSVVTSGTLSSCFVEQLSCGASSTINVSSTLGENCTINELICGGQVVNISSYEGNVANCVVTSVACAKAVRSDSCAVIEFGCVGDSICDVTALKFQCRSAATCPQLVNMSSCICPIDRNGTDCSIPRALNCSTQLVSPTPNCGNEYFQDTSDPKANLLDGDPACLVFSLQETAKLQYTVNCRFLEPLGPIPPQVLAANFSYYIENDQFALSDPDLWGIRFKIFNFNMLSDLGASTTVVLEKDQMQGISPLWFNVTLNAVPDKYWAGNRLYAEVAWINSMRPAGVSADFLDRRFIDSPDYKGKGSDVATSNVTTILLAVFIPLGVVALITMYCVLKRKGYIT